MKIIVRTVFRIGQLGFSGLDPFGFFQDLASECQRTSKQPFSNCLFDVASIHLYGDGLGGVGKKEDFLKLIFKQLIINNINC